MTFRSILFGAAALALMATSAFATDFLGGAVKSTDIGGKSVCNDECAVKWPPLMAEASAAPEGDFTVVTRDDGSTMWAYKGWPLYYWYEDMAAGDTKGDGVGGVWHLAVE